MISDLDGLQLTVGEWGMRTFPDATNETIVAHLWDEVDELRDAGADIGEEAADCLLLLLHLAHRNGFSLMERARAKHVVNTRRTWQTERNERGYYGHVEPEVPS